MNADPPLETASDAQQHLRTPARGNGRNQQEGNRERGGVSPNCTDLALEKNLQIRRQI